MSTKATVLYSGTYHLYEECMSDDLYLELSGDDLDFKVTPKSVTVLLPAEFIKDFKAYLMEKEKKKR